MRLRIFLLATTTLGISWAQPRPIVTGLQGPQKLILTPSGNLLISETNQRPNLGRISFATRSGARRSLFENMPSGTEVTGGGSGPTALALRERTLYVAIGGGEIERRAPDGSSIHNPAGISSPLFASVLEFRFDRDVDMIGGTFRMTPEIQQRLADGDEAVLEDGQGARTTARLLVKLQNSIPDPRLTYRFANPWGLALAPSGRTLYLTDGSMNSLVAIDTQSGRPVKLATFENVPNYGPLGPPTVESVPTSVRVYGDQLLVSFLSGVPFQRGNGRVLAVNPERRTSEPFIFGLTSCTDVLYREMPNGRAQFWVLEFSLNQLATPPAPGRLLRYDTPSPVVVVPALPAPTSLALDERAEVLYILSLTGQVFELPVGGM